MGNALNLISKHSALPALSHSQGENMNLEGFVMGTEFSTSLRQIAEADVKTFLDLSLLKNPIFMDDQAAQQMGHPKRILPAPL
ncbi:MAG: hypothetical protein COX51_01495 [Syntrophobacteraceae bacterium CG23_combo_of_CG06-09_8_20_14_all_50_8]|nr:MAG: hypothetical protein COX51_01495 [Syntrophobacteraceae bacterium CG23_combo_of_CG06-09_8_20_14_all_50_8]